MVGEVFHDVGIETKHAEFVPAHYTREELHEEDLVVKGETFVVLVEHVIELFSKGLGIVEELDGGEVRICDLVPFLLLLQGNEYF